MKKNLITKDDVIIDAVLEKNNELSDLTKSITDFFGKPEYNTTRETLLGNMCNFFSDTIQETIIAMATKACHVSVYFHSKLNCCQVFWVAQFVARSPNRRHTDTHFKCEIMTDVHSHYVILIKLTQFRVVLSFL